MTNQEGVYYAAAVTCHDCGIDIPCGPEGIRKPGHECRSEDIRVQQASLAAWEEGYRWGIENYHDEGVQADVRQFGAGWIQFHRQGGVLIEGGEAP